MRVLGPPQSPKPHRAPIRYSTALSLTKTLRDFSDKFIVLLYGRAGIFYSNTVGAARLTTTLVHASVRKGSRPMLRTGIPTLRSQADRDVLAGMASVPVPKVVQLRHQMGECWVVHADTRDRRCVVHPCDTQDRGPWYAEVGTHPIEARLRRRPRLIGKARNKPHVRMVKETIIGKPSEVLGRGRMNESLLWDYF